MQLTDEQLEVVSSRSRALKVVAFAGAGKTSTLRAYAAARPSNRLLYLAFNKAISREAASKFPPNVSCLTTHSLAYRSVGSPYRHKLQASVRADQAARALGLYGKAIEDLVHARKSLRSMVTFLTTPCLSFEDFVDGYSTEFTRAELRSAQKLWEAMIDPKNMAMPMLHDGYLKLYQLSGPVLDFDGILFDEAQDANPVTSAIVRAQKSALVFVGDPHQQIYQFRGAENAMDDPCLEDTLYLTESFRFGAEIAETANTILSLKREKNKVRGGRSSPPTNSMAFIARGNAAVFTYAVSRAKEGQQICFVGGIAGYKLDLLLDIWRLRDDRKGEIQDNFIKNFKDFDQLVKYADSQDERDLRAWINVIWKHRDWTEIPNEINLVKAAATDSLNRADSAVATAHKSKGLEFGTVQIADDFPVAKTLNEPGLPERGQAYPDSWRYGPSTFPQLWAQGRFKGLVELPTEELNLMYVVATRAEGKLLAESWGSPVLNWIRTYVARHPDFLLVDKESDLGHQSAESSRESPLYEAKGHQGPERQRFRRSDGYDWAEAPADPAEIATMVERQSRQLPQWSWAWIATEAQRRRAAHEPLEKAATELLALTGINPTLDLLMMFFLGCGLVVDRGREPRVDVLARVLDEKLGPADSRLADVVFREIGARIAPSLERFQSSGWFGVGKMDTICPTCSSQAMYGFRKPYQDKSGRDYHYWALICRSCNIAFEPIELDATSRRWLSTVGRQLGAVQERSSPVVPKSTRQDAPTKFRRSVRLGIASTAIHTGQVVFHESFGRGVVSSVHGLEQVRIDFDNRGAILLDLRVAKLYSDAPAK